MKNYNDNQKLDNITLLLTNDEIKESLALYDTLELLTDSTPAQISVLEAEVISSQQVINLN